METADTPNETDLFIASPTAKYYWLSKEAFHNIGGLLYHRRPDGSEKDLLMPQGLKKTALKLNHDLPSSGYQGVDRTKAQIKDKLTWYWLGKDVSHYVAACPTCNQNKKATAYGRVPMQEYYAGAPMERIHLDFLGPLQRTPLGNEYVLMMVDQFMKWSSVCPCHHKQARSLRRQQ